MIKLILLLILLMNISIAKAGVLHLMAGGGANFTFFNAPESGLVLGEGLNFSTDLGYYFNDQWALEWGVKVKFNKLDDVLVWDTLMTIGPRYQFKNSSYYTRLFWGRSPTVIHNNGKGFVRSDGSTDRIQFDGPVYGMAFGKLFKTKKDNIWVTELTLSYQELTDRTGVREEGDIPIETFRQKGTNPIQIFSIMASIGVRVF